MIADATDERVLFSVTWYYAIFENVRSSHMSRRLTFFVILLFLTLGIASIASAQNSWQQVIDREADFTVSFPGQPTYQTTTDPATGLQTEIYKFFYTGHLLRITIGPLPQLVRTPAEFSKVYGEFAEQVVPLGGVLLRQQKLLDGGRQYDTVANTKDGTIYGRTRLYIHNGRYYALAFEMYALDGINEREAERFLSSFSFLDTVPKRRAPTRNNLPTRDATKDFKQPKWYTFRAPDSTFTVEFPGRPSYQFDPSSGTGTPFHRYHYFYGENVFQVSYREDPEAIAQPEQVIQKAVELYTSHREGWRVLRKVRLPDGGHQIESQGMSGEILTYSRVRMYVRGGRVYYITALTQNLVGPNKNDIARFFESFRFL